MEFADFPHTYCSGMSADGKQRSLVKGHTILLLFCLVIIAAVTIQMRSIYLYTDKFSTISKVFNRTVLSRNYPLAAFDKNAMHDAVMLLKQWTPKEESRVRDVHICPISSPHIVGRLKVDNDSLDWESLNSPHRRMDTRGSYVVTECKSRHHVAVVIPYRDRDEHLRIFLHHMIPIFIRQQLNFGIYVIEQLNGSDFNRGMLMNIGYMEALKDHNYRCFVFSDVDLLLEDDRNIYGCPRSPTHLSVAIDSHNYKLKYSTIFGGVVAFKTEHFRRINGFSNQYFKWGGEDDDLRARVVKHGFTIRRPDKNYARYKMSSHKKQTKNPQRHAFLKAAHIRMDLDGLNSLRYDALSVHRNKLFTKISVDIDQESIQKDLGYYNVQPQVNNTTPTVMTRT